MTREHRLIGRSHLSPVLVGRRDEVGALEEALISARAGETGFVVVTGEAGIGKSRLARHAQRRAGELGGAVIMGTCEEGSAFPYLPFVEGVGNHLLQLGVQHVRRRLGPLARELTDLFPQLDTRYTRPAGEDPLRSKGRLYEAIASLLHVLAEDHSLLLLVVEDLQWADASSVELLGFLTRRLRDEPIAILTTVRITDRTPPPELETQLEAWSRAGRLLDLPALTPDEVGQMAGAILGLPAVDPEVADRVHYLSEGNPLIVEEIVRQSGFDGTAGGRALLEGLAVPAAYTDRIRSQLGRLDPHEVTILEAAAVLAPPFSVEVLAELTGSSTTEVAAAMRSASSMRLVEGRSERFQFRHHLIRESLYEAQASSARRDLHLRAARVLENRYESAAFEIVRHLQSAGAGPEAVPACVTAAGQAMARRGYEEAVRLYSWTLGHVKDKAERGRILASLGEACYASAHREIAVAHLEEAVRLLDASGLRLEAAKARLLLGTCEYQGGHSDRAGGLFQDVIDRLSPLEPSEPLADAYVRLASLHVFQLEAGPARELAQEGLDIARKAHSVMQQAWANCFLGVAMVIEGDLDAGLAALDSSYHTAAEHGLDWIAMNAAFNGLSARLDHLRAAECPEWLARLRDLPGASLREAFAADAEARMLLDLGDVEGSLSAAQSARRRADATGTKTVANWSRRRIALALAEAGRIEQAVAELAGAPAATERQELLFDRLVRIRVHLAAGELEVSAGEARKLLDEHTWLQRDAVLLASAVEALVAAADAASAERLLDAALDHGLDVLDPYVELAFGRLTLAQGFHGEAAEHAAQALSIFEVRGYRLEELRSGLLLARCEAAAGRLGAAQAHAQEVIAAGESCGAGRLVHEARALAGGYGLTDIDASLDTEAPAVDTLPGEGRLGLISRMPAALRDNEFVLHYQPELDLATGRLLGVEALVRWQRGADQLLGPDRFVPLAEQAGLINELTGWVLDSALRQAADWLRDGTRVPVAVNVSMQDLERPTFVNRVAAALSVHRTAPDLLTLEVTETSAMLEPAVVMAAMERLRGLGVRVAIDDFGVGQTSLAYLRQLPVDIVKLDRSFATDLGEGSLAIVRSVITMAHDLGLLVVAEGIERREVAEILRDLGCDAGQGYHLGRPAPAEVIGAMGQAAV